MSMVDLWSVDTLVKINTCTIGSISCDTVMVLEKLAVSFRLSFDSFNQFLLVIDFLIHQNGLR